jgi:hypothetical protein
VQPVVFRIRKRGTVLATKVLGAADSPARVRVRRRVVRDESSLDGGTEQRHVVKLATVIDWTKAVVAGAPA